MSAATHDRLPTLVSLSQPLFVEEDSRSHVSWISWMVEKTNLPMMPGAIQAREVYEDQNSLDQASDAES